MMFLRCGSTATKSRRRTLHLYTPATAYRIQAGASGERHPSKRTGQNPPAGAVIYYYLKDAPKADTEARIEILDESGKVIRKYSSTEYNTLDEPLDPDDKKPEKQIKPEAGLNRFVWDLRYEEARRVPGYYLWEYGAGARGPVAVPGHYQVRLTVGKSGADGGLRSETGSAGESQPVRPGGAV